ncbi:MAG: hypothetical protein QGI24_03890, partial [Kiritimatiellia bacterium]|nr:hypothetical protein [Kiritimatiellia bacterium]MDP6847906.1 hypothetical protein [Kiritimatiellia bacterium]
LWGKQNLVPPFHPAPVDLFHNADGSYQVVMDSNVLISALRSKRGPSFRMLRLIGTGKFEEALTKIPDREPDEHDRF